MRPAFRILSLAALLQVACAQILSSILGQVSSVAAAPPVVSIAATVVDSIASGPTGWPSIAPVQPSTGAPAASRIASAQSSAAAAFSRIPLFSSIIVSASSAASSAGKPATATRSIATDGLPSTFATSTASTTISPTSTADAVPSSGLSTGAKAAIGVVIPIALLLVVGLLLVLWRRKKRAVAAANSIETCRDGNAPQMAHSGLMVPAYEDAHDPSKPELDSTTTAISPPATSSPPPLYAQHLSPNKYQPAPQELVASQPDTRQPHAHELAPSDRSATMQPSNLGGSHAASSQDVLNTMPADVGPAIVIPSPYHEEEARLEQLRAQRAAVARERERKEEIDRMRAEEERLDRAIAEIESRRY